MLYTKTVGKRLAVTGQGTSIQSENTGLTSNKNVSMALRKRQIYVTFG